MHGRRVKILFVTKPRELGAGVPGFHLSPRERKNELLVGARESGFMTYITQEVVASIQRFSP